jgi:hypothetical protein
MIGYFFFWGIEEKEGKIGNYISYQKTIQFSSSFRFELSNLKYVINIVYSDFITVLI